MLNREEILARVVDSIDRVGRHVQIVLDVPPFAYTVGNSLVKLPELIVFGLGPHHSADMLNRWSDVMIDRGCGFADGELVELGGRFPCLAMACREAVKEERTLIADVVLGRAKYDVVQLIVPDTRGRFPGDAGCDPAYAGVPIYRNLLN